MIGGGVIAARRRYADIKAIQNNGVDEGGVLSSPGFTSYATGVVEFWYRPTTVDTAPAIGTRFIFYLRSASGNQMLFMQRTRPSGFPRIDVQTIISGVTRTAVGTTTTLVAGVWHHIQIKQYGTAIKMWINGVAQTIGVSLGSANGARWFADVNPNYMAMACACNSSGVPNGNYADISLNDIRIYGSTYSDTEAVNRYNANGGLPYDPALFTTQPNYRWTIGEGADDGSTLYGITGGQNIALTNCDASNYVPFP